MTSRLSTRSEAFQARLRQRQKQETRFKAYGIAAIVTALSFLCVLLGSMIYSAIPALTHHNLILDVVVEVPADQAMLDRATLAQEIDWRGTTFSALQQRFPDVTSRSDRRALNGLLSMSASDAVEAAFLNGSLAPNELTRVEVPVSDDFDLLVKGVIDRNLPETDRIVSDRVLAWIELMEADDRVVARWAWALLTNGDSREPEMAGIKGAFIGTLWTMLVTLLVSLPIGVMAAVYLQEIAPRNRFTDFVEVNINNLAAVPSIVFGLLGLAVFINIFHMPRSSPLVGGLVLALMTLPTIIIATRASLAAVPPSIREAALGIGASRLQVIMHHVLPLALPGILTGTIIGLAQAAGETAPLLMVGMMAFIVDTPTDVTAKATVLPAQIYMWANNPERAFVARTSAAILILLILLLAMNALAIYLRKRFEKRW